MKAHYQTFVPASNHPKNTFEKMWLISLFDNAIISTDALEQRQIINEGLRYATIKGIDGLDILRQALNRKHDAKCTEHPVEATAVIATDGFQCPKCSKPFKSANALNAHRPKKCQA